MNTPTPFSGERKKLDNFLLEIEMYQMINNKIYNTDRKKIIFALFFMKDGVAEMWKQHTAENATFGTWEEFKDTFKKSFTPTDKEGDVITKMQTASITEKTADEFIKEFKNWQLQSGVNKDRPMIEWSDHPGGLVYHASNLDNQWRKFKAISACLRGDTDTKKKGLRLLQNESQYTPPVMTFSYSELLRHLLYSSLQPNHSRLILYDILTVLSVSLTVDFPLIDYFSHDYSS